MRILTRLAGLAVLFTTLGYAHLLHHHLVHSTREDHQTSVFWVVIIVALISGILSFIGAILLLKRPS
jgi:hypothetical protein